MFAADKVWITELTLIHKNNRSVRNFHAEELTDIEIIWQCDVKMCLINTHYIHSVMKQDFVSGQACCVNQYH
jgi:hypothetical protein